MIRERRLLESIPLAVTIPALKSMRHINRYVCDRRFQGLEITDTQINIVSAHLEIIYKEHALLLAQNVKMRERLDNIKDRVTEALEG